MFTELAVSPLILFCHLQSLIREKTMLSTPPVKKHFISQQANALHETGVFPRLYFWEVMN